MLNKDASNGVFEKKEFKINQKALNKTPIYHFFHSQTEFYKFPEQPIEFTCIVCEKVLKEMLRESTNLNR
jgi:hypothetical protein